MCIILDTMLVLLFKQALRFKSKLPKFVVLFNFVLLSQYEIIRFFKLLKAI